MNNYGIIGYPLTHSFSQRYFLQKFAKEGLTDCTFEQFPIVNINAFPDLLKVNPALKGLAITIPYKEQVLPYVTEFSLEVQQIGATNCIKVIGEKLVAYNTDCIGFEQSLIKYLKPTHTQALILGNGGASKAVQYVLNKLGIPFLVVTRNNASSVNTTIDYAQLDEKIMNAYTLIINCTPLGMHPDENTCPAIPYQFLTPQHYLFDLVYNPSKTLFLQKGEERGAAIQNGYEMLQIQAEANWKLWNED